MSPVEPHLSRRWKRVHTERPAPGDGVVAEGGILEPWTHQVDRICVGAPSRHVKMSLGIASRRENEEGEDEEQKTEG